MEWMAAIEQLAPVAALRSSRWTYAAVNASHITGLALLIGAIVPLDLKLLGFWRTVPIRTLADVLVPVAICGLVIAIVTGSLLFATRASEYAGTTLFQIKMALVAVGISNAIMLRRAARWNEVFQKTEIVPGGVLRVFGALSIVTWLATLVCGRMLAFLE
jgi:hypothetical protein